MPNVLDQLVHVPIGEASIEGRLVVPEDALGIVLFAHGSGSSRHSPRNTFVAESLQKRRLATLLIDLLTEEEERIDRVTAEFRFDIELLADRLMAATSWLVGRDDIDDLDIAYFGASTGAAAALIAAARSEVRVKAVVSRGGRPDLAMRELARVGAPALLVVGGEDHAVVPLNKKAFEQLNAEKELAVIPGATHLFEEEGALEQVADLAGHWFVKHLGGRTSKRSLRAGPGDEGRPFAGKGGIGGPSDGSEIGGRRASDRRARRGLHETAELVAADAEPFSEIEAADVDRLLDRIGSSRLVLIGEATHGTSEFYRMRQHITKALVERRGFNIVAVEADWPDAERVDAYVRHRPGKPEHAWEAFSRFPSWMWRNHEVLEFVEWLHDHNAGLVDEHQKCGFYGLDLYSLYTSIDEVLRYLRRTDPQVAGIAQERYDCLSPFQSDPGRYGSAVITNRYQECEEQVMQTLGDLLRKRLEYASSDRDAYLDAEQNARVVAHAERYYKRLYHGAPESWNLRDSHMFETLKNLLAHRGPSSKAAVWAHNSHVGHAGATSMSDRGQTNIGELARDAFGNEVYAIGFGTHTGTVAASSSWGGPVEFMGVRPSRPESYEHLCHLSGVANFMLPLGDRDSDLHAELLESRLERAIGVVYRPGSERQSHYFRAVLPDQFDEYVWFDRSEAVSPLEWAAAPDLPERHPFLLAD